MDASLRVTGGSAAGEKALRTPLSPEVMVVPNIGFQSTKDTQAPLEVDRRKCSFDAKGRNHAESGRFDEVQPAERISGPCGVDGTQVPAGEVTKSIPN
ncbi:hypothetical protein NDU88_004201 [Pleurodeles waltl]|uniref:Uncharacterized protein n=1 Tax=Pleurodeles waltl TaxID=8319 RepID=A0AAV7RIV4_PLEWA|nr:hypothetical protein NDU88_004201 [Pleurodeles waltl]